MRLTDEQYQPYVSMVSVSVRPRSIIASLELHMALAYSGSSLSSRFASLSLTPSGNAYTISSSHSAVSIEGSFTSQPLFIHFFTDFHSVHTRAPS